MQTNEIVEKETISPSKSAQLSVQQKLDYCSEWEKSGLSKIQFCRMHNISLSAFKYWRTHIYTKRKKQNQSSSWAPVVAKSQAIMKKECALQLEFEWPNKVVLRVSLSSDHAVQFIQELSHAIAVVR